MARLVRKFAVDGQQTGRSQRYDSADPAPVIKVRSHAAMRSPVQRPRVRRAAQSVRGSTHAADTVADCADSAIRHPWSAPGGYAW